MDADRVAAPVLCGLAAVAGSFAVSGATRAFVVTPAFDVVARVTPGFVVGFFVTRFPGFADAFAYAVALALALLALSVLAAVGLELGVRVGPPPLAAVAVGALVWLASAAVTARPVHALGAAVAAAAVAAALVFRTAERGSFAPERRRVLIAATGVAGFGLLAGLYGRRTPAGHAVPANGRFRTDRERALAADAASKSLDVPGLAGLLSANEAFYTVDIDTVDPVVAPDSWTLSFRGAVTGASTVDYGALVDHPDRTAVVDTLRCVSDPVDGSLVDTAVWTGVPVDSLLRGATVTSACECVMVHAADGYAEEFPLDALSRGFLAVGMNGDPLPRAHGYPVRLLVPGHWGEVNVKWVTAVEFLEREAQGYWEKRGWHGTGPVNTVTKIRTTASGSSGVQLAGVAYAGTRGVARVEVSVDGGDTWEDARLSDPLTGALDGDVWRQWAYTWADAPPGRHDVLARAVTSDGTVQPRRGQFPYPSGAAGWAETTVRV